MFFLNFCGMYGGRAGLVYEVGIVHCLLYAHLVFHSPHLGAKAQQIS